MPKKDPLLWDQDLDWYLNCSDSAIGYRSSFASLVARIEGQGSSGENLANERLLQLTSSYTYGSPLAKIRSLRPRWASLDSHTRDVLSSHYTLTSKVDEATGFRRFPRGVESRLGQLAGVALYLAQLSGTLKALLIDCERQRGPTLEDAKGNALEVIRAAHKAWVETAGVGPDVEPEVGEMTALAFVEAQEDWVQVRQIDGIWKQVG